jgi:hypothetical protein
MEPKRENGIDATLGLKRADGTRDKTELMQHFGRRGLMEPYLVWDWCNI